MQCLHALSRILIPCLVVALVPTPVLQAEPYVPDSDDVVLLRLTTSDRRLDATHPLGELRRRRAQLSQSPGDLNAALDFANFALQVGRSNGDPRVYGYLESALAPWLQLPEPTVEVLLIRATVAQHRHQFEAALIDLESVLRQRPRWAQPWLTRAVILSVRGDLAAALTSCQPLSRLASPVQAAACRCHVEGLGPNAERAYDELQRTLDVFPDSLSSERQWALVTLGDVAKRLGHNEAAEAHYLEARALDEADLYSQLAYADLLLDADRPQEVIDLLRGQEQQTSLLLRLVLAEQRLGSPQLAEHRRSLRQRYAAGRWRQERLHMGEEARFALALEMQPAESLELAEANWQAQREPIDSRILLEAALAAQRPDRAQPVVEHVRLSGLRDVQIDRLIEQLNALPRSTGGQQ